MKTTPTTRCALAGAITLATLSLCSAAAHAGAAELMPPSTHPGWFVGGVGPSFYGLTGPDKPKAPKGPGELGRLARVKLALDFGYHLSGSGEGAALGATVEQTFDDKFYVFNPGFKFFYDIHITDYAIYVTPQLKAGYALGACKGCTFGHALDLALGVEGRVVFGDRWMTFLRPVYADAFLGDFFGQTFVLSYDVLLGGGVTF